MASRSITTLKNAILDFLFPPHCVSCARYGTWLCDDCTRTVSMRDTLRCVFCFMPSFDGRSCSGCRSRSSLSGVWWLGAYAQPVLRIALRTFKYQCATVCAHSLSSFFVQFFRKWPFLFSDGTLFLPIPLHPKKERDRGFNQAHLLVAHALALRGKGVCGCWLVARRRATRPQVSLPHADDRAQNMEGAFAYIGPRWRSRSRVVLVDDVWTTGATMNACAQALANAGASDIWGFVLARG